MTLLTWKRLYPGHYVADNDRYEIIHTPDGWEFVDRGSGFSGTAKTLREAKTELDEH